MYLLWYADDVKGYRLWDPTTYKIVISKDIIFTEDKLPEKGDDNTSKEKSKITMTLVEDKPNEDPVSFEAIPEHEGQELAAFRTFEVC